MRTIFSRNLRSLSLVATLCVMAATSDVTTVATAQFAPLRQGENLDAIVAVVGKHPVYKSTIDGQLQLFLIQRGITSLPKDTLMQIRKSILENEIDQKVMLAKADADSITVSEPEIDEKIDDQVKMFIQRLGSEAAVEKQFGKSIPELKASQELRDRAKESLLIERERYRLMPSMTPTVSRRDVEEFYRSYRDSIPEIGPQVELATIVKLVKTATNQRERSKAFAQSLLDSIRSGADFATLATRYSQHNTAKNGGDLGGFYARGTFLTEFEEAAFKLKPGEVSDVIETVQGFHIIKLIERRGDEVHLAQILIKPTATAADEELARQELLKLRDRALKGEDFAQLARENSDDPESRLAGGSLGRIRVEDLSPEQRELLDSLQSGSVSMPKRIQYPNGLTGFQVVKLVERIAPHQVSLATDYRELEQIAMRWKQDRDVQRMIEKARSTVYVDVKDLSQFY